MLSYRHAFHAGNFADVLKHTVLVKTIRYLLKKESPLLYIDTHAGAGNYDLTGSMQEKTQEIKEGATKFNLEVLSEILPEYSAAIGPNLSKGYYPGSPKIAADLLRKKDLLQLFELHPADHLSLQELFKPQKNVRVSKSSGYAGLKALLPSKGRRAVILIDPSYEIKSEYHQLTDELVAAHKRMPSATFLLWYPVVDRIITDKMLNRIKQSHIRDIISVEFGLQKDAEGFGMTSSGMLIVNPPWILKEEMSRTLEEMKKLWGRDSHYQIRTITEE